MAENGQHRQTSAASNVVHWTGRVFAAEDVRFRLNGCRELIVAKRTIVTPLAVEELRAKGIQIRRQEHTITSASKTLWGFTQEQPNAFVQSAVGALAKEGLILRELPAGNLESTDRWIKEVAQCVAKDECQGAVVFCEDAGLACCVANKVAGLRAAAIMSAAHAGRALLKLAANLIAVELAGRTFFEIRQILRTVCQSKAAACPEGLACTLRELDSHAHR